MQKRRNLTPEISSLGDPDNPPKTVGSTLSLGLAESLMRIFRQHGMTDSANSKLSLNSELVSECVDLLQGKQEAIHLYLLALSQLDYRAFGSVFRAAVRMAAQYKEFYRGRCPEVLPSYSQSYWAASFLMGSQVFLDKDKNRLRVRMRFLAYTGPQAGAYITGVFSRAFIYVMARDVGAALKGKHSHLDNAQHPEAINFVRALCFIESKRSLVVTRTSATASMRAYNRKLVRTRFRDIYSCPFGALFDCVQCGAFTDECERSVRLRYEQNSSG